MWATTCNSPKLCIALYLWEFYKCKGVCVSVCALCTSQVLQYPPFKSWLTRDFPVVKFGEGKEPNSGKYKSVIRTMPNHIPIYCLRVRGNFLRPFWPQSFWTRGAGYVRRQKLWSRHARKWNEPTKPSAVQLRCRSRWGLTSCILRLALRWQTVWGESECGPPSTRRWGSRFPTPLDIAPSETGRTSYPPR